MHYPNPLIPAKAGTQAASAGFAQCSSMSGARSPTSAWVPAFAGMSGRGWDWS
jgi:hypothetical protein